MGARIKIVLVTEYQTIYISYTEKSIDKMLATKNGGSKKTSFWESKRPDHAELLRIATSSEAYRISANVFMRMEGSKNGATASDYIMSFVFYGLPEKAENFSRNMTIRMNWKNEQDIVLHGYDTIVQRATAHTTTMGLDINELHRLKGMKDLTGIVMPELLNQKILSAFSKVPWSRLIPNLRVYMADVDAKINPATADLIYDRYTPIKSNRPMAKDNMVKALEVFRIIKVKPFEQANVLFPSYRSLTYLEEFGTYMTLFADPKKKKEVTMLLSRGNMPGYAKPVIKIKAGIKIDSDDVKQMWLHALGANILPGVLKVGHERLFKDVDFLADNKVNIPEELKPDLVIACKPIPIQDIRSSRGLKKLGLAKGLGTKMPVL